MFYLDLIDFTINMSSSRLVLVLALVFVLVQVI